MEFDGHQSGSSFPVPRRPAPNREHDRDRDRRHSYSSLSSNPQWRESGERGDHEREGDRGRREDERDREPASGARKRSFGHHNERGREDRGSNDRRERKLLFPLEIFPCS